MVDEIGKRPKDWWGNPENAQKWLEQDKVYDNLEDLQPGTNFKSLSIVLSDLDEFIKENGIKTILEVGAGSGRLIGNISNKYPDIQCYSVDINSELSKYVKDSYPKVITSVSDITELPFESNSFDLVFTYQVLQHIPPEEIHQALKQLLRVSRKEIWLYEGYTPELPNGLKRHKAHNGAFAWKFNRMIKCYEYGVPKNNDFVLNNMMLYKIRKQNL